MKCRKGSRYLSFLESSPANARDRRKEKGLLKHGTLIGQLHFVVRRLCAYPAGTQGKLMSYVDYSRGGLLSGGFESRKKA